jgi:hypothetical protein
MLKRSIAPLHEAREFWRRLESAVTIQNSAARSAIRKQWRRSWAGKTAWPWLKREIEIVSKVSGVVVVSLWMKRLIEQFLARKILNEATLKGEIDDIVRVVEDEVQQGRSRHVRTGE